MRYIYEAYLIFLLKGMVLACECLLSACRTWPLQSICPRFLCACVLGHLAFTNCIVQFQGTWVHAALPFQKFLRRGRESSYCLLPTFFSEMYHLAFTEKEGAVPAWGRGQCSPWYICNLQRVYVYSKEWVQCSSKKPKSGSTCRNDEQIANRIHQCKAVVVTDPWGFIVEL